MKKILLGLLSFIIYENHSYADSINKCVINETQGGAQKVPGYDIKKSEPSSKPSWLPALPSHYFIGNIF